MSDLGGSYYIYNHLEDRLSVNQMSDVQRKEFEALYCAYWRYIYKWEVGHEEDFDPAYGTSAFNNRNHYSVGKEHLDREDFNQDCLEEHGMMIKVNGGY